MSQGFDPLWSELRHIRLAALKFRGRLATKPYGQNIFVLNIHGEGCLQFRKVRKEKEEKKEGTPKIGCKRPLVRDTGSQTTLTTTLPK